MQTILFIGNGVNNINNASSWEQLLQLLYNDYYDHDIAFDDFKRKPFPMLYEQIVMKHLMTGNLKIEDDLKKLIAGETLKIKQNAVHEAIANSNYDHIITTNYEFGLMNEHKPKTVKNLGCIRETKYSLFRHFEVNGKTYWHPHGDAQNIRSINLGYEHYCGQLQRMREYVTNSFETNNEQLNAIFKKGLVKRNYLNSNKEYSWIDFFFKKNTEIKIIGFRFEFEEIDLWWLLTYRAKFLYKMNINERIAYENKVIYYVPVQYTIDKFAAAFQSKKDMMEKMDIEVRVVDMVDDEGYYINLI